MKQETNISHPLILCSHCVYDQGGIYSDYPEDKDVFEKQLRQSVQAMEDGHHDILIISGGYTKTEIEKSEARGMLDWAIDLNLKISPNQILLEEFARDSFENVLFSICRFHEYYDYFPQSLTVCSWESKRTRFMTIANALRLLHYSLMGVGIKDEIQQAEDYSSEIIEADPLHRGVSFAQKRVQRDTWEKGNHYAKLPRLRKMFDTLTDMEKKGLTNSSDIEWPWLSM